MVFIDRMQFERFVSLSPPLLVYCYHWFDQSNVLQFAAINRQQQQPFGELKSGISTTQTLNIRMENDKKHSVEATKKQKPNGYVEW